MSEIRKLDRTRLPHLRKVEKEELIAEVRKVDELLKKIESKEVTDDKDYLGTELVTKVFEKNKTKGEKKQP